MFEYIKNFEKLGFGMFVHFGLYSVLGKGEWYLSTGKIPPVEYENLTKRFKIRKSWAKDLLNTAKAAGCRYITLTTRHHDGFSLFDTCGLNDYDSPHSACGRDLVREFVEACQEDEIVPFFYHTLLDWHNPDYKSDFPAYIEYLIKSIGILCKNYGKIGGFWFDGMWDKPNGNWQEDRLYKTIRKYQPKAIIINNTGLSELGQVGHPEIDSVTFERGAPCFVNNSDKPRAGEMCQILNDHWGYAKEDCNYKSVKEFIENLVDCRKYNCNFLLNTGLKENGGINGTDKAIFKEIGKWLKANKGFIYRIRSSDVKAENADMVTDGEYHYAIIKDMGMILNPSVTKTAGRRRIKIYGGIESAKWLDNGKKIEVTDNTFPAEPFEYGTSYSIRVAKIKIK